MVKLQLFDYKFAQCFQLDDSYSLRRDKKINGHFGLAVMINFYFCIFKYLIYLDTVR